MVVSVSSLYEYSCKLCSLYRTSLVDTYRWTFLFISLLERWYLLLSVVRATIHRKEQPYLTAKMLR